MFIELLFSPHTVEILDSFNRWLIAENNKKILEQVKNRIYRRWRNRLYCSMLKDMDAGYLPFSDRL